MHACITDRCSGGSASKVSSACMSCTSDLSRDAPAAWVIYAATPCRSPVTTRSRHSEDHAAAAAATSGPGSATTKAHAWPESTANVSGENPPRAMREAPETRLRPSIPLRPGLSPVRLQHGTRSEHPRRGDRRVPISTGPWPARHQAACARRIDLDSGPTSGEEAAPMLPRRLRDLCHKIWPRQRSPQAASRNE